MLQPGDQAPDITVPNQYAEGLGVWRVDGQRRNPR